MLYSFSMLDPEFMPFVFFDDYDYFVVEFLIRNKNFGDDKGIVLYSK